MPDSWIQQLSPALFWDVKQAEVSVTKHRRWILERVLERGLWEDWKLLSDNLSREDLQAELPLLRVNPKSKNWLEFYLRQSS